MADRNILITGASRGLGKALAEYFLQQGDNVVGCSRSEGGITHENYHHYQVDVTSAEEVAELFFKLRKVITNLDGLINNAGVASMNAFALTPDISYQKVFSVNVQGTYLFCQKALTIS